MDKILTVPGKTLHLMQTDSCLASDSPLLSNEAWEARRELAEALREFTETLLIRDIDVADLHAIAAHLRQQNGFLQRAPFLPGREPVPSPSLPGGWSNRQWRELNEAFNPFDGSCNPLAPPLRTWTDEVGGHGRVTLGWAHEGPPGVAHGGVVSALLDHFLGITQRITGQPGVTGALDIRFLRPTPLHTELVLTGRVKSVRGPYNVLVGEISAKGEVTARAQGIFVHGVAEGLLPQDGESG